MRTEGQDVRVALTHLEPMTANRIEIGHAAKRLIDREMPSDEFFTDDLKERVWRHLRVAADWWDIDVIDADIRQILVNNGVLTATEAENTVLRDLSEEVDEEGKPK